MKNYSWEETQKKYSNWLSKCSLKKKGFAQKLNLVTFLYGG